MPPNTIKVDRTTRFGNPFVVGVHGTRAECVKLFGLLLGGYVCLSHGKDKDGEWHADKQIAYTKMLRRDRRHLIGKNLACWCPPDQPCHADILLSVARRAANSYYTKELQR
jgi:hypothetical protein